MFLSSLIFVCSSPSFIRLVSSASSSSSSASTTNNLKKITLLTFDVDGTLIKGSGASAESSVHAKAFSRAIGQQFGKINDYELQVPTPLSKIKGKFYHGSTDGLIALHFAKEAFGVDPKVALPQLQEVFKKMYSYVKSKRDEDVISGVSVLPGVLDTLTQLRDKHGHRILCGLVTGNVEGIARIKMRACGIHAVKCLSPPAASQSWVEDKDYGFLGGFGSDYCSGNLDDESRIYRDRGEQICIAYERAVSLLRPGEIIARVVHVGDAPGDILAAKMCAEEKRFGEEVTVGVIGVATGKFSVEELSSLAGEPVYGCWEPTVLKDGIADPFFLQACKIPE